MRTAHEAITCKESSHGTTKRVQTPLLNRHYYYRSKLVHRGIKTFLDVAEGEQEQEQAQVLVLGLFVFQISNNLTLSNSSKNTPAFVCIIILSCQELD